jgi:hypothetical protein
MMLYLVSPFGLDTGLNGRENDVIHNGLVVG